MQEMLVIGITLLSAIMVAGAQYFFKKNLGAFTMSLGGILKVVRNRGVMVGIIIYALALVVYLVALRYGQLSYVYPVFASSFVFTMIVANYVLREKSDWKRVLGILITILGIAIVALT